VKIGEYQLTIRSWSIFQRCSRAFAALQSWWHGLRPPLTCLRSAGTRREGRRPIPADHVADVVILADAQQRVSERPRHGSLLPTATDMIGQLLGVKMRSLMNVPPLLGQCVDSWLLLGLRDTQTGA